MVEAAEPCSNLEKVKSAVTQALGEYYADPYDLLLPEFEVSHIAIRVCEILSERRVL